MKQILGIIILSWLLFGCSFWETSGRLLDIGKGTPIEAHPYAYDLVMSNPLNLAVVKDKLLLFQHTGEDAVLMMDRESGKPVGCWGVAGVTAYHAQDKEMMSDLALANVEALARDEGSGDIEIVCGLNGGACWMRSGAICFVGEATYYYCQFVGYTWTSCSSQCN